jgi:prepilin-type N-terminal cleavage/methylation domain-containing protein
MNTQARGFTLIEILLSVAIMSVLIGLSLPMYNAYNNRNDLDLTSQTITEMMRRAMTYSRGMRFDDSWAVHIQTGSTTLYKGTVYATRDASYDESATIPSSFTMSGMSDVSFAKMTGLPSSTGVVTLAISGTSESRSVTLNGEGMVSY